MVCYIDESEVFANRVIPEVAMTTLLKMKNKTFSFLLVFAKFWP